MGSKSGQFGPLMAGAILASTPWWAGAAWAQDIPVVATPLQLETAQFVSGELMSGPNHQVEPIAFSDGFVTSYTLSTEWGDVPAAGNYRLRMRIQEANALKALDEMSRAGVFGESLLEGAMAPVDGAVALITDPVNTVSDAAEGVGTWFGNIANSITSDDPNQEGALSAAVGWAATKRSFAVEMGVDPYTDWEPLQEALSSVGQAAFAGGISAKVAMGAATRDTDFAMPVLALSLTDSMKSKLADNPPERLAELNRAEMAELGISDAAITPFLDNHNYSPQEKVQFVDALNRMSGVEGLEVLVINAARAPDRVVARYMQQQSQMIATFAEQTPVSVFSSRQGPLLKTGDGRVVGVFPLDYIPWTDRLATIMPALTADADAAGGVTAKELWFEGSVSPDARQGMESHGWTVNEDVQILLGGA